MTYWMAGFYNCRIALLGLVLYTGMCAVSMADILITKLDDFDVATNPGRANDLRVTNRFCVASNPVGPYSLEALGSGVSGNFTIQNGPHSLVYELSLRDQRSGGGFQIISPGIPLTGLMTHRLVRNQQCPGNTARLRMTISTTTLGGAVSGNYGGSLQLTVIPE